MNMLSKLLRVAFVALLATVPLIFSACSEEDEEPMPVAAFMISPQDVVVGEYVTFQNQSENATAYEWSFDNGETSTEENPMVSFSSAGTYTVTLITTGAGGTDQTTMDVTVEEPTVMFMDGLDLTIYSLNISNGSTNNTISLDGEGYALAIDYKTQTLFYNDFDNEAIESNNITGGNELSVVTSNAISVFSIAIDTLNSKLYFPNRYDTAIYVANLDGSEVTKLFGAEDGIESPTDVALDVQNNTIYISDVGFESSGYAGDGIWAGSFDGSSLNQVIVGGGYSLAIDPLNQMLYYNDAFVDANLKMAPLNDLSNPANFATLGYERCYGIFVYGTKIYWSDLGADIGEGLIYRANLDGTNAEELGNLLTDPRHLVIVK